MKATNWAVAVVSLGVVVCGKAMADEDLTQSLRQPTAALQAALGYDSYHGYAQQEGPSESPSDRPVAVPEESAPGEVGCFAGCEDSCDRAWGRRSRCRGCSDPWGLPQPWLLASRGITVGGWMEVGISGVASDPADRFNGVVTFNDRDGEVQMNQLWFYLDREADTGGYGWDVGGHVDFVYGTDAVFTQAVDGLEATWGQTERFYQVALPQFYLDVAVNDLTLRMGHFYTILGYEVVQAPENFFYSHAYTMQYGEPFTHTGLLGIYQLSDQWAISGGLQRGIDQFDDTDGHDSLGFLGGLEWLSRNERLKLALAISATEQGVGNNTTIYSLVGTWDVTDRLTYVLQHDYGQSVVPGVTMAEWYGVNQYLLYEITPRWAAGLRFEWFRDHDGARVAGVRPTNVLSGASFPGSFYEITAGLNWKPRQNIIVRPEFRWDWYEDSGSVAPLPYDAGDRDSQFLFGIDMIVTY